MRGKVTPWIGFSLPAVFIACSRRSLSVPKPAKQNGGPVGDHSSIWDSWPMAFSGYPRGPRVGCETGCPKHTAPNLSAETRSRTRVSREPTGHRQRRFSRMERTRSKTLKLFVVSDDWRRSTLLSSIPSVRSWQFFWPRLAAPSPAAGLWQLKLRRSVRRDLACWKPRRPHP